MLPIPSMLEKITISLRKITPDMTSPRGVTPLPPALLLEEEEDEDNDQEEGEVF